MRAEWSTVLACPQCRGNLTMGQDVRCSRCGPVGRLLADQLIDFAGQRQSLAAAITAWPDELVRALPAWAEAAAANATIQPTLLQHGLVNAGGGMTEIGELARYHLDEQRWQKGRKGLDGVLTLADVGPTVRVLDVGCGAGQTLRLLEPDRPVELFGVDVDTPALALGCKLAAVEGIPVTFAAASATALPFRDATFNLIVTRVALNYVHQRSALAEMARVLRPGGFLFCRVERIWHDVGLLRTAGGWKGFVCRLRDLGWGVGHALTGWQPRPGSRLSGGRSFASAGRLRRILSRLGCSIRHADESPNGPTQFGRRTQLIVVAQKSS